VFRNSLLTVLSVIHTTGITTLKKFIRSIISIGICDIDRA
uniref:Transcriptional regulator n=1 Tax=Ascaris lumbricoides TaxID=6252 RepID=A0A0M3IES6_ASCLU